MASDGNQGRMVFDIRGRRKTAVKVVYAVLAVLMGASLFLVTGGINLNELFNGGNSTIEASQQFEEQAQHLEAKLKTDPENPEYLGGLARARLNAGNSLGVVSKETGETLSTTEGRQQFQLASDAWSRYLKATDEPSASLAGLMPTAFLALAPSAKSVPEAESNLDAAVEAQEIVVEKRPTVNSLTTLASYQFFAFDFKGAEKSEKEALALAHSKAEKTQIETRMDTIRKRGEALEGSFKAAEKEEKKARQAAGNPLGSAVGGALGGTGLGE